MMPETSGWEVLDVRAIDSELRKIPVIVISADASDRTAKVLRQGICALLPKPFDLEVLGALMQTCIDQTQARTATENR